VIRRLLTLLVLSFVFILQACVQHDNRLLGVVVYGHEVRTVRLCGETQQLWLHMTPEQQLQLKSELQEVTTPLYQEAYIEFTGSMLDVPPGELAREYDGTIKIKQILKLSITVPDSCSNTP